MCFVSPTKRCQRFRIALRGWERSSVSLVRAAFRTPLPPPMWKLKAKKIPFVQPDFTTFGGNS